MGVFDFIGDELNDLDGVTSARAARDAANQQVVAGQKGSQAIQQGYGQGINSIQSLYSPYTTGGTSAFNTLTGNTLNRMYSLPSFNYSAQNDPTLKFQMQQGIGAANNSLAARGGALGGNALKALTDYGQNLADTYQNQGFSRALQSQQQNQSQNQTGYNNLFNIGQTGYNASTGQGNNLAQLYTGQGNNLAQNYAGIGNAQAAGTVGVANAKTSGTSQLANLYGKYVSGNASTIAGLAGK